MNKGFAKFLATKKTAVKDKMPMKSKSILMKGKKCPTCGKVM
jgi:hypothetical protein